MTTFSHWSRLVLLLAQLVLLNSCRAANEDRADTTPSTASETAAPPALEASPRPLPVTGRFSLQILGRVPIAKELNFIRGTDKLLDVHFPELGQTDHMEFIQPVAIPTCTTDESVVTNIAFQLGSTTIPNVVRLYQAEVGRFAAGDSWRNEAGQVVDLFTPGEIFVRGDPVERARQSLLPAEAGIIAARLWVFDVKYAASSGKGLLDFLTFELRHGRMMEASYRSKEITLGTVPATVSSTYLEDVLEQLDSDPLSWEELLEWDLTVDPAQFMRVKTRGGAGRIIEMVPVEIGSPVVRWWPSFGGFGRGL